MAGPIDEEDDDVYDFRRPPGPSPREVRAGWARDGDVEQLWRLLAESPWDRVDQEDVMRLLVQALEVRSRSDPEQFAADVFGRMIVFTTSLLLRCHLHLASYVEGSGRAVRMRAQPPGDLPKLAVDTLIPRVVQLQEHLAAVLVAQSSVARQWSLVRRNRAKHAHPEGAGPGMVRGKERSAQKTGPCPKGRDEGKVNHRLAAVLNGRGPGADEAHHDD